ncbi:MAG TPA: multicopper oxidase domain-containing protein [Acidobacteriota bacterium]|nr:multicopper oxidase domain-containing protein [Acidobacteriota bacterium]
MNRRDSNHTGIAVSLRRLLQVSALLALAVVAWEYMVNALLHPEVDWSMVGLGAHAALDYLALLPLVLLALSLGLGAARRLSMDRAEWMPMKGTAALVALLLFALVTPLASLRDMAHEEIGQTYGLPLARVQATAVRSDLTIDETTQLCSFSSVRNPLRASGDEAGAFGLQALGDGVRAAATQQAAFLPLLMLVFFIMLRRRLPRLNWRRSPLAPVFKWATLCTAALALLVTGSGYLGSEAVVHGQMGPQPFNACTDGGPERVYDVSAIHVTMTLNRFGDNDPDAFMYVLDHRISDVRAQEAAPLPDRVTTGLRQDPIQPLVIRANLGECLVLNFTNRLTDGPASIHILGLAHDADNAGGEVGENPNTFAAPNGGQITYRVPMPTDPDAERSYYFHDHGASRQRINHGLFGAVVAEPEGSTYVDVETGMPSDGDNWESIIIDPNGINFREFVIMYHEIGDETFTGIQDGEGKDLPQVDDVADIYRPAARALNYRSEPFRNRLLLESTGKALGYASYPFGDPATPIPRSYLGEATKTRLMHGGSEVFHVHHLHGGGDRWRRNPNADPNNDFFSGLTKVPQQNVFSTHLDSQSIGPGTSYNLEHECGAGGCQQSVGDFLYHCHIGHHYIAGMWAFWRVFGTVQTVQSNVNGKALAVVPGLFQGNTAPPQGGVSAFELLGTTIGTVNGDRTIVLNVTDPMTEISVESLIENQLPPPGVRIDKFDATVWDWIKVFDNGNIRYFGEPEALVAFPNYESDMPGQRPEILFNPKNGRYTWPLFRPHLAQRPPFSGNGHTGAPWLGEDGLGTRADGLCPHLPGAREIYYPTSAITLPIQVSPENVDTDGMIFALNEDKAAIFAGQKPAEPLAIRSNVADCVEVLLTNEIPDGPLNSNFSKVNIHSHFVQFDPQASDGVITGFSYEQSIRPHLNENRFLAANAPAGATSINVTNVNRLRPGIWIGIGLGEGVCPNPDPTDPQPFPCTEIRRIEAINGLTIDLDGDPLLFAHASGESVGVEFVRYNWYSDVDTGTVFFHTHVEFKDWDHGLFGAHIVEPKGSTYHDPVNGLEVRSGTLVDIRAPRSNEISNPQTGELGIPAAFDADGPFREFVVFLHNNSAAIGQFDNGGGTINLRSEPFDRRMGDPAFRFSSVTHGDPFTQELRAYVGDPVVFRGMGLVERVGGLRVSGHRFKVERFADTGNEVDTTFIGISERFDFALEGGAGGVAGYPGDYLYYSTISSDFESGAWGLMRVHDTLQPTLQPLPGLTPPGGSGFPELSFTGGAPPSLGGGPGDPCLPGAPTKTFDIEIAESNVVYNTTEIVDSGGIVYGLLGGVGVDTIEPLVMRVNEGDCVDINLTNNANENWAGIHLGEVLFDPQRSFGAAVGLNYHSLVADGGTRSYRFYADEQHGLVNALNLGNTDTIFRGAYAAFVVEPPGSTYYMPGTTIPISTGVHADIETSEGLFREAVLLFVEDDRRMGQNTMPYPPDSVGIHGISYASEPFDARQFENDPEDVFDSDVWGDPRLTFSVPAGMPMTLRVGKPWGGQRGVFHTEGHRWFLEKDMAGSEQLPADVLVPGMTVDAVLVGGAGGDAGATGDFIFGDRRQPLMEAGMWGIIRVTDEATPPQPDDVDINRAEGKQPDELRVEGRNGQLPGGGFAATITIHQGAAVDGMCTGAIIGMTSVNPSDGKWRFQNKNLSSVPAHVCAMSSGGGVDCAAVDF